MRDEKYLKGQLITSILGLIALICLIIYEFIIKGRMTDFETIIIIIPFMLINPLLNLWKAKKTIIRSSIYYALIALYFFYTIIMYVRPIITVIRGDYNLAETQFGYTHFVMLVMNLLFIISSYFIPKMTFKTEPYHGGGAIFLMLFAIMLPLIKNFFDLRSTIPNAICSVIVLTIFIQGPFMTSMKIKLKSILMIILSVISVNFFIIMGSVFLFLNADFIGVKD